MQPQMSGRGRLEGRYYGVKPIFHCNANPFVLGSCVSLHLQYEYFALGIPTCWYLKNLVDPKQGLADPTLGFADPTRGLAETTQSLMNPTQASGIWFMLFVSISFALGTQREPVFSWNMGLWGCGMGSGEASYIGVYCLNDLGWTKISILQISITIPKMR